MVNQERDLLDAIIAQPDDDLPRLGYADWLDEQGRSERAELIRLQIQLANSDVAADEADAIRGRCRKLIETHWDDWRGCTPTDHSYANDRPELYFRRGFIEDVAVGNEWDLDQITEMMRVHPITKLRLLGEGSRIPDWPLLMRIRELHSGNVEAITKEEFLAVLHSPYLTGIRELDLYFCGLDETEIEYIGTEPKFAGMRSIRNLYGEYSGQALLRVLRLPNFRRLTQFDFPDTEFNQEQFQFLSRNPLFAHLRSFSASPLHFLSGTAGFDFVIRNLPMPELRELVLQDGVKEDLLHTVQTCSFASQLERLSLNMVPAHSMISGLRQLFHDGTMNELRTLRLSNVQLSHEWVELLRLARLPKLRSLSIDQSDFDDEAIAALAESSLASSICKLDLHSAVISDAGAIRLATDRAFHRLRELSLAGNRIGREGAKVLSQSRIGRFMTWWDLMDNPFTQNARILSSMRDCFRPLSDYWPDGY